MAENDKKPAGPDDSVPSGLFCHRFNGVVGGHHSEQPQKSQGAHAEYGDQHRHHGFSCPTDGTRQKLHQDIGDVAGGQEPHHAHTDLQHIRIRGEDGENGTGQQEHNSRDGHGESSGHGQRHPYALLETVILAGAVVLAGKGG